jgi:D-arabinose 1-dehydrogenase-like Zn-dependent alcohol dehydrogenase
MLVAGQKSVSGSVIGGRAVMREMLSFAARHNIKAQIEEIPMIDVNSALEKVRRNQARYRMVLKN